MRQPRFNPSHRANTCKWCGRKLRKLLRYLLAGEMGDGHFCNTFCGYLFGTSFADQGFILRPAVPLTPHFDAEAADRDV